MSARVGVAVAGAGMAGQAHAFGFRNATMHPGLTGVRVELAAVVDPNLALAESVAARYGFARAVADLDDVLGDPAIDAVSLALPNFAYADVIPRTLDAGKHVLAEKPLGRSAAEAHRFATAADAAGVVHAVDHSWLRAPAVEAIARIVEEGRIGRIRHASGWYLSDYAATVDAPLSWRYDVERAGGGAITDLGAHVIAMMERVAGPFRRVLAADARTLIAERPVPAGPSVGHVRGEVTGETGPVTNDDVTSLLVELRDGGSGSLTISRVASGEPNSLGFALFGSEGSVTFESSHPDELRLYTRGLDEPERNGPRRVVVSPAHPYFADTVPIPFPGVSSGYGAFFIAHAQAFLRAIIDGEPVASDFWAGHRVMLVCDAVLRAAAEGRAVDLDGPGEAGP